MPDISENYSSLREAVNRILGQPAGGAGTQGGGFDLAPKPSYSSDLGNIGTSAAITNTPFDPYAEQKAADAAQLASIRAETNKLAAQVAPAAAAVPAAVAAVAPAVASIVSSEPAMISRADLWSKQIEGQKKQYMDSFNQQLASLKATGAYTPQQLAVKTPDLNFKAPNWGSMGGEMVSNPYAPARAMTPAPAAPVNGTPQQYQQWSQQVQTAFGGQGSSQAAPRAPVNPGSRAPWQASQQYWKDLDAYRKAGGK